MRVVVAGLVVLVLTHPITGLVAAGGPETSIKLVDSPGFVQSSEVTTPNGAVIATFVSAGSTINVIGRPGSSATLRQTIDPKSGESTIAVEMKTTRVKSLPDARSYAKSGRSAVKDLIALGAPPAWALEEFGDLDVMDPVASARVAGATSIPGYRQTPLAVSKTIPYDTQCASVRTAGGEIQGWGCSTLYLIYAVGGDWWFNNKYKFTAWSTEEASIGCFFTGFGCPWRLTKVGWSLQFGLGNILADWDPASVINKSGCSNTQIVATYHGASISIATDVCPTKIDAWNITGRRSGSMWFGVEQGTDHEATIGLQSMHNPPGVAPSYTSPMQLTFAHLPT
jgi:hypothetical protein